MKIEKIYKYQISLYVFIIVFGIQNYFFNTYNFDWIFYEQLVKFIFLLSFFSILVSLILLTYESVKSINRKEINFKEILYLLTSMILYYFVILTSFYLANQTRI